MAYPSLDEVALRVRAGAAAAVIVEGEDQGGDAWIYGDIWFVSRAAEVRFFPQDGWTQVVDAVRELRRQLPANPIFGLIDRDFTPDDELEALEPEGIYRSRCYSVENYLLDPHCWQSTVHHAARIRGGTPEGWRTVDEVTQQLQESYLACLPATAFNLTIAELARVQTQPTNTPLYVTSLRDHRLTRAEEELNRWKPEAGAGFHERLSRLQTADRGALPQLVNGKLVVDAFVARLQGELGGQAYPVLLYINDYLARCPDPPSDGVALLDKILAAARGWNNPQP